MTPTNPPRPADRVLIANTVHAEAGMGQRGDTEAVPLVWLIVKGRRAGRPKGKVETIEVLLPAGTTPAALADRLVSVNTEAITAAVAANSVTEQAAAVDRLDDRDTLRDVLPPAAMDTDTAGT